MGPRRAVLWMQGFRHGAERRGGVRVEEEAMMCSATSSNSEAELILEISSFHNLKGEQFEFILE